MEELLTRPLTQKQMHKQMDSQGYVEGTVAVDLDEIIDGDRESFLHLLSELLTDTGDLEETEYEIVGHEGDSLHVHVTGNASGIIEEEEEYEEEEEEDYE